ncbi:hypothetical protein LA76x_3547 [Lysobacter antibioticus]|uniref:Uncharacterized protein n=1 Tax=Lysobacter antibioticus TaxID=84531 RepID=A0A0S2FDR8_LYSAN|nr:hypothetical protein LA76x_3547 [Lysobacter antibioticus]
MAVASAQRGRRHRGNVNDPSDPAARSAQALRQSPACPGSVRFGVCTSNGRSDWGRA